MSELELSQSPVYQAMRSRRSVRRFQEKPVPRQLVADILEAATWAPSAHNRQPWRFVILESRERRRHLAQAMGQRFLADLLDDGLAIAEAGKRLERSRQRIMGAPVAILLCLDASSLDIYPDRVRQDAETLMGVQSVALAGGQLLLAAQAAGLGGVWMCAPLFAQTEVIEALHLDQNWQPQGLILLGYPTAIPAPPERVPFDEIALFI